MSIQIPASINIFEINNIRDIPAEIISAELAQAERRLETWESKSYYEKVASLARVADFLPDQTDQLSIMIKAEIDSLLTKVTGKLLFYKRFKTCHIHN